MPQKKKKKKKNVLFRASYLAKKVEWVYCVAKFTKELWRPEFKQNETELSLFSSHLLPTRSTAQRKGKQSRHDVNISTSVKEELHPVEGPQSQAVAKSYIKYTIMISTSIDNYRTRSNTVYRQKKITIKIYHLLLPGWCYLIKIEVEER